MHRPELERQAARSARALLRARYRIRYLALIGATFVAYGVGIVIGYRPTFLVVRGLPVLDIGWAFIALGVLMFVGVVLRRGDRPYYVVAAAWTAAWSATVCLLWTQPVGWTAAVSWMCVSVACLLTAAWPEPPRARPGRPLSADARIVQEAERHAHEVVDSIANGHGEGE